MSDDLAKWKCHGVAVKKGTVGVSHDCFGAASPAGMAFLRGKLYVPFSARRTARFEKRSIGLAVSGNDPEKIPWTKTEGPISNLVGEDDDPAVLVIPGDDSMHLFHRRTGPGGYRIVHSASKTPFDTDSWPAAKSVTPRPKEVWAQELTGVFATNGKVHLLVIKHLFAGGMRISHLVSENPSVPFKAADPKQSYLSPKTQPATWHLEATFHPLSKMEDPLLFYGPFRKKENATDCEDTLFAHSARFICLNPVTIYI